MEFKYSPLKHPFPSKDLTNSSHTSNKPESVLSPKNQFKKVFISPSKFINTGSSNQIGKHMCQSAKYNNHSDYIQQNVKACIVNIQQKQSILNNIMKKDNVNKTEYVSPNSKNIISPYKLANSNLQNINIPNPQRIIKNQHIFNSNTNLNDFFTIKEKTKNRQRKYSVNDLTASSHNNKSYNNAQGKQQNGQKTKENIEEGQYQRTRRYTFNEQIMKKQNQIDANSNEKKEKIVNVNVNNNNNQNFQFIRDRKLSYQPNISQVNMLKKEKSSGQLWLTPPNILNNRRQSDLFPSVKDKKQQKFSTTPMYSPKDLNSIKRDFQKKPFDKQKKLRKFSDNNESNKLSVPSFLAKKSKKQNEDEYLSSKETQSNNMNNNYYSHTSQQILPKKLSLKNFRVIRQLGQGKFGKVLLVQEINCKFVCAMKVFKKSQIILDKFVDQLIRQMKIQSYLNHPNIIKMYGYFDDYANIYVLIQLACDGTLFKFLQDRQIQQPGSQVNSTISTNQSIGNGTKQDQNNFLTQKEVSIVMYQVCNAISYLHTQNIIHRDLKPQNIVIHQKIIKLCDFGWSVFKGSTMRNTFCGTPLYLCPQLIVGQDYDEKVDIWAIGIMFYQFLIGTNPFKIHVEQDLANIVYQTINLNSKVDPLVKNMINGCLDKNPKDRFNIKQILNHEFFKQNCPQIINKLSKSGGNKLNQIMI